jgi:hypothetical protein
MAITIALSWTLVLPILALMPVPMLRAVVKSEGVSPIIFDEARGCSAIDPKLQTSGSTNLDLVIGVGRCPCTNIRPVPVFADSLSRYGIVEDVNLPLLGTAVTT